MINVLLAFIENIFIGLGALYFFRTIDKKRFFIIFIAMSILNSYLFIFIDVFTSVLFIGILFYSLRKSSSEKNNSLIWHTAVPILLYILSNYLLGLILTKLNLYDIIQLPFLILLDGCFFFLLTMFTKYIGIYILNRLVIDSYLLDFLSFLSILLLFSYYSVIISEQYFKNETSWDHSNLFFISLYTGFGILLLIASIYSRKKEIDHKQKEAEMEYMFEYLANLEETNIAVRKFKHDYQNILISLSDYIASNNIEGLKKYFDNYLNPTVEQLNYDTFRISKLGNIKISEVKSILINKIYIAQNSEILVKIEVPNIITDIHTNLISLVRCLGIILDNAIEAASEAKEKTINIAIFKNGKAIQIIVSNTCPPIPYSLSQLMQQGFSTKGSNRGLGLSNLNKIAEETQNIFLETSFDDYHFVQIITIGE